MYRFAVSAARAGGGDRPRTRLRRRPAAVDVRTV